MKTRIKEKSLYNCILASLFIQMLLFPKLLMWIKLLFIIIAVVLCLDMGRRSFKIDRGGKILLAYIFWNVMEILIGIANNAGMTGIREGTVTVVWPLAFLILAGIKVNREQLKWLYKIIIMMTFVLCIADIVFIFSEQLGLYAVRDIFVRLNRNTPLAILFGGTYPAFRVDHLYFYAFLAPFMITVIVCQNRSTFSEIGISKKFTMWTAILAIILAVLSGMGGIWFACVIGALLCLRRLNIRNIQKMFPLIVFGVFILICFCIYSYLNGGMVYGIVCEVINRLFPQSPALISVDDLVRKNQAEAMLKSWAESPFIGHGSGYPVEYYRGNEIVLETDSELMYLTILYQRGIVGLGLFLAVIIYVVELLHKRNGIEWLTWPFSVGMISFMAANIFNPYFSNMSMMWIVYFPFLISSNNIYEEKACEKC